MDATVTSIPADICVNMVSNSLEACHIFGKTERKTKSTKYHSQVSK